MARLTPDTFTKGKPLAHNAIHPVKASDYHIFQVNGEPLLHIRTFSTPERKKEGKACQNIQLDRDMAKHLVAIMKDAGLLD